MTDQDGQARFIRELLQLYFPKAQAPTIAASAVGRNQQRFGLGIEPSPFTAPPAPNRGHGKSSGIVIGSDIDETGVAPNIVDAIGIGAGHLRLGKVMPTHWARLFRRKPLLAAIVVIADQFFLFRVHGNYRPALLKVSLHGGIDVPELRIAIGMILSLFGLAVALQTIAQMVKHLGHLGMTDRMLAPS
jgi:hypothetical protein